MSVTVVSAREAHSCPAWCERPPQDHDDELVEWEHFRYHRACLWERGRDAVVVNCVTRPTGDVDLDDEPPGIDLGDGNMMSAADARAMASALIRAATIVEGLTR